MRMSAPVVLADRVYMSSALAKFPIGQVCLGRRGGRLRSGHKKSTARPRSRSLFRICADQRAVMDQASGLKESLPTGRGTTMLRWRKPPGGPFGLQLPRMPSSGRTHLCRSLNLIGGSTTDPWVRADEWPKAGRACRSGSWARSCEENRAGQRRSDRFPGAQIAGGFEMKVSPVILLICLRE
jgi:hypothetical protein